MRTSLNQLKVVVVWIGLFCLLLLNGCTGGGGGGSSSGSNTPSIAPVSDTSKEIVSYNANGIAASINQQTKQISFILPYGSDMTNVNVDITTTGASVIIDNVTHEISTVNTSHDFTKAMTITVKARDGSTSDYTAVGAVASKTSHEIISYSLKNFPNNAAVIDDQSGTISLTLPAGTVLSSWVANFETTGVNVTLGDSHTAQVSGETENDFSKGPVVYTVHAADGSTKTYTVVIAIASATDKAITSYSIGNSKGYIDEQSGTILLKLPFDSTLNSMVATFSTTGEFVTVGTDTARQVSGETENDFSKDPVVYTVHAADGSTKTYKIMITIESNTAKEILKFGLVNLPGAPVIIDEQNQKIFVTVPYNTDLTNLTATFATTGSYVTVFNGIEDVKQYTGKTVNNFNTSVTYKVHAADGSTKDYAVTITPALNSAKEITSYSIKNFPEAPVTIDEQNLAISVTLPYDTDLSKPLVAIFATTGNSITDTNGASQVSGVTENNFADKDNKPIPVKYVVTAADSSTKTYTVNITTAKNTAKDITKFYLSEFLEAPVTIDQHNLKISVTVPYGTDLTRKLVANFITTGNFVTVSDTLQKSGNTENIFKDSLVYRVHAADGSTKDYTVAITPALNNAKEITNYEIKGFAEAPVTIDEQNLTIKVTLPYGTDLSKPLVAIFATSGKKITDKNGVLQVSGETENKFADGPVDYVVTAEDGSTKSYVVTVVDAKNNQKEISTYSMYGIPGTFNGDNITVVLPFAADITDLRASFTYIGKSVNIIRDGVPYPQRSDETSNNFENSVIAPVEYTVTAEDGSVHVYYVTVKFSIWTWTSGSSKINQVSVVDGSNNGTPGGRSSGATWTDANGFLWMFGGSVSDDVYNGQVLSDLWVGLPDSQNPGKIQWVLKSDTKTVNTRNLHGTYPSEVGKTGNPGARLGAATWRGNDGALWMYGGYGFAASDDGLLGDLWRLDYTGQGVTSNPTWTWVGGSNKANLRPKYVSKGTEGDGMPGSRRYSARWTDAQGNLWLFGGSFLTDPNNMRTLQYYNDLWKYDISSGKWSWMKGDNITNQHGIVSADPMDSGPGSRAQSVSWVDHAGNLWLFGGYMYRVNESGRNLMYNDLWKYSPATNIWTLVKGVVDSKGVVQTQQKGVYGLMGLGSVNGTPGGRVASTSWTDDEGNLWLFGGEGISSDGNLYKLNDLWKFNISTSQWIWMGGVEFSSSSYMDNRFTFYGTLGVGTLDTRPGSREDIQSWIDNKGHLMMFGGLGYGATTNDYGFLNDFWVYNYK